MSRSTQMLYGSLAVIAGVFLPWIFWSEYLRVGNVVRRQIVDVTSGYALMEGRLCFVLAVVVAVLALASIARTDSWLRAAIWWSATVIILLTVIGTVFWPVVDGMSGPHVGSAVTVAGALLILIANRKSG